MEIKNINNLSNSYPRKVEMSRATVDEKLLNKWKIIGLSSIVLNGLLGLYAGNAEAYDMQLAGDVEYIGDGYTENTNTIYTGGETSNFNTSENTIPENKTSPEKPRKNSTIMQDTIFSIVVVIAVVIGGFFYFSKQKFRIEADYSDDSGDNDE